MTPQSPGPETGPRGAAGTDARRAFGHAGLNLVAGALPIPLALITIPAVIRGFGVDRYGVLATAGVVLAYLALLDFGLARAVTRFVARALDVGDEEETAAVFGTVTAMGASVGVVAGVALLLLAAPLARGVLRVPPALTGEAVAGFRVLAAAVPFTILLPTMLSALEGRRRFDLVAAIQVPVTAAVLLAPLLVLPWTDHIAAAVAATVIVQAVACGATLAVCLRSIPGLSRGVRLRRGAARRLLDFGRWVAVSNVVGPVMVNLDRFAIGAVISVGAVTYYAAPYSLVTQLLLVPSSLMRALFPLFSTDRSLDVRGARPLAVAGVRAIALVMGPAVVLLVATAPDMLHVWLGAAFARASTASLQLLAVGVAVNALAMVPFWLLYGLGRPDLCAKFHLVELALYVPGLLLLLGRWGITGAAVAWTGRVSLDAALLAWASWRVVGVGEQAPRLRATARYGAALVVLLILARLSAGHAHVAARLAGAAALGVTAAGLGWWTLLTAAERAVVRARLPGRRGRGTS
jgi:O-antigen/teichoic acid export membrane protein